MAVRMSTPRVNRIVRAVFWLGVLVTTCSCIGAGGGHYQNTRIESAQYQFSVVFPEGLPVCPAMSGEQVHGYYVHFGSVATDCNTVEGVGATISVYAYANTTFEQTPKDEATSLCHFESSDRRIDIASLTFPGRLSASCRNGNADGSIDIFVVTQAGRWPDAGKFPEFDSPYVNYIATLHTFSNRIDGDLDVFRKVLASVEIGYAE